MPMTPKEALEKRQEAAEQLMKEALQPVLDLIDHHIVHEAVDPRFKSNQLYFKVSIPPDQIKKILDLRLEGKLTSEYRSRGWDITLHRSKVELQLPWDLVDLYADIKN